MVELSSGPYQHGFPNIVFIPAAIIFVGLSALFGYKLYKTLLAKQVRTEGKTKTKKINKKTK